VLVKATLGTRCHVAQTTTWQVILQLLRNHN
jgi:hypothetical protein